MGACVNYDYRVIFSTLRNHSRVPGEALAGVTTSTHVDDTDNLSATMPGYTAITMIG